LGVVDYKDILKGGNKWIGDVVGETPESKEGGYQDEGE
jgi:hypothetical protein